MEAFIMEIAALAVCVQPLFQSTREYCKAYLSDKKADIFVGVTQEELAFQQLILEKEAVEEGLKIRRFTEPFLERAVIQRKVADALLARNTLMVHGSTVAVDGRAYLFTAPCKTGKSTHTKLWRELFGDRAVMVNDDMPFLQITPEGVLAYGSPWCGKHGLGTNVCVPLQGICFLNRGSSNEICRIGAERGAGDILRQVYMPADEVLLRKACALVDKLAENVPLWEMHCNKEPDAARVSYLAMSGNAAFCCFSSENML